MAPSTSSVTGNDSGTTEASGRLPGGGTSDYALFMYVDGVRHGASLAQLTSDKTRIDAHRFYERLGFKRTHDIRCDPPVVLDKKYAHHFSLIRSISPLRAST